jgi:Trypsin
VVGKKLLLVAASGCALLFGMVLASPALARRSPRNSALVARELARLDGVGSHRSTSGRHRGVPHQLRIGIRPRIIGGYGGVQSDWPFVAFIAYFDSAGNLVFNCTGTVVSPNVVLTAAHCAVDEATGATLDPSGFAVVTGSVDWTDQAQRQLSPVSRVILDPSYVPLPEDTFDAALLVLSKPTTAPAIPLATSSDEYLDAGGTGALIAGWGATYYGEALIPALLQWAPTVVQDPSYCGEFDPYFDASSQLCAVNPPDFLTATCNGDSGGPLAAFDASNQLVEIGIITNGPTDCNTYTADNFANVIPLSSWVSGWIQAVAPPPPPPPSPPPTPAPSPPPSTSTSSTAPPTSPPPFPTMTLGEARRDVRQTVVGALGGRAKPANSYSTRCSRRSSARFTCAVNFSHGPNDYYGTVTVYFVSGPGGLTEWTDSYTLHWVNDGCYFHSGHPNRCTIHTRRGTF